MSPQPLQAESTDGAPEGPPEGVTTSGGLAPSGASGSGSLIRQRDFQLLLAAKLVSTSGDMFYVIALPFLVFGEGGGVGTLTTLLAVFGVARVCSALPAGALSDRIGPRKVMLGSDLARAIAVAGVAVYLQPGHSTVALLIAVAVLGLGEGCFQPASQAMVPTLVTDDRLPAANALAIGANLVAAIIGPALGGLGVVAASPTLMLALDSGTFLVSMALLLAIRGGTATAADQPAGAVSLLQFVRQSALFRTVLLMMAVFGLSVAGTLEVALPLLAAQRPELGAAGYGLLMSGLGLGWLIGGSLASKAAALGPQGWIVVVLLALDGLLLAVLPWAPGAVGPIVVMVLMGCFDGLLLVTVLTVIQRMPPPYLRGRVMGLLASTDFAMYPLSAVLAGVLLAHIPVAGYFAITGAGVCVVAAIGASSRGVRSARAVATSSTSTPTLDPAETS